MFAAAALVWAGRLVATGRRPRIGGLEAALAFYVAWAMLSWAVRGDGAFAFKLLGMVELCALLVITADLARDDDARPRIAMVLGLTSLAVAAAAVAGEVLFLLGQPTRLVGTYGDLVPGGYARAQAGLSHPNLLASFCVFASTVVAWGLRDRRPGLARLVQAALALTVALTASRSLLTFALAAVLRGTLRPSARLVAGDARPGRRGLAVAATLTVAFVLGALTLYHLRLDPTRPWAAEWTDAPSVRWQAATSAACSLLDHPWLGVGLGHAPATVEGAPFDAHCTPLDVAATLGLPALAAFLSVPLLVWRRSTRRDPVLWSGLLALALEGLTQDVADFRHLWILLGLAAASREPSAP